MANFKESLTQLEVLYSQALAENANLQAENAKLRAELDALRPKPTAAGSTGARSSGGVGLRFPPISGKVTNSMGRIVDRPSATAGVQSGGGVQKRHGNPGPIPGLSVIANAVGVSALGQPGIVTATTGTTSVIVNASGVSGAVLIGSLVGVLGTWSEWADVTIPQGQQFDFAQWNSGASNVTYQILGFYGPLVLPSGASVNGSVMTNTSALSKLADGPNLYVKIRQTANGVDRDTTIPISVCFVAAGVPTYSVYAPDGVTLRGGPFTDINDVSGGAQRVGGTTGTPNVPSTYDIIKVSGGAVPLNVGWVPKSDRMFRIVPADPTLPIVKDFQGTPSNLISNGGAGSAPVNYYWDVSGIWCRNSKALDSSLQNGAPGSGTAQGGALRMTTLCNHTQHLTVRDSIFEDCVEAEFSSNLMGEERFYNIKMINCGAATGLNNCHGMYVHADYVEFDGIDISWTFNYDMLPANKKRWAGDGHELKTRCPEVRVGGIRMRKAFRKADGSIGFANTSQSLDFGNGGLVYITGSNFQEGLDSAYSPPNGISTKTDQKIIAYNAASQKFPVNEFHLLQSTIVNDGQPTENFVRWLASGMGPSPATNMKFIQGDTRPNPHGTVDGTAHTFTTVSVANEITNDGFGPQFPGTKVIYNDNPGHVGGLTNGQVCWLGIVDDTHAALYNTKADSIAGLAGARIPITPPANGAIWSLTAVPDVYRVKDCVLLGTTPDGPATLQGDGNTYGQDNEMGAITKLVDPSPLRTNYQLITPVSAAQNWTDNTGQSVVFSPT